MNRFCETFLMAKLNGSFIIASPTYDGFTPGKITYGKIQSKENPYATRIQMQFADSRRKKKLFNAQTYFI